jgi:predicted RND superfamily exporter protein
MVFLSILSLAVCLIPHFRWALRDALMAAIPALCAIFWTLGLLSVTNKELGLYSILVLPVVIGIAVNQAVIFIQRLYDREYASLRQVMRAGGKPGVITGFVLVLGLGCLLQVRFQPLREMTSVLLIAAIFTTVSTLILLPAILQIRESGGISGWEGE